MEKWLKQFKNTNHFKDLNEAQQQAIELSYKHNGLVIAGAGTGKTKTLITRIIALIQTKTFLPEEIVALTFTNKAAYEMKERLEKTIKEKAEKVNIGTFHSFALRLIKENPSGFGFNLKEKEKIHLLDEAEQLAFIKKLFIENHWETKNKAEEKLLTHINQQKEKGIRSHKVEYKGKGIKNLINQYKIYEKTLKEKNILDFSDLVLLLKERLENDIEYKKAIQQRFKTYLIDEFQDTNPIQYQTILLLTENHSTIFAVGDDCQSIYSFRGAEVKNILKFEKECMKNHTEEEKTIIKLEQNYRSSKNIVELSNKFIENAKERIEKNLWTNNDENSPIYIYKAFNEYEEARFVAETIEKKLLESEYRDFAVIYRGNNQSAKIETMLSLRKIPYKVSGGMSFLEKAEIKTLLACLNLLINKNNSEAFVRVINKVVNPKIDKKILKNWEIEAEQEKQDFSDLVLNRKAYRYPEFEKLFHFIDRGIEEFKYSTMKESVEMFLTNIGFFKAVEKEKNKDSKLENIQFFLQQVEEYENQGGENFANFIYRISQTANTESQYEKNVVNLMTIHSSKGLEFKHVFFIGLEDGIIPSTPSIEEENIQEELRLMYVGMTRAKETLYLSFCENRFNGYEQVSYLPTRFFYFLNEKYIKPINTNWLPEPLPYFFVEENNVETKNAPNKQKFKFNKEYNEEELKLLEESFSGNPLFEDLEESENEKSIEKIENFEELKELKNKNKNNLNVDNAKPDAVIKKESSKNKTKELISNSIIKDIEDVKIGESYIINNKKEKVLEKYVNEYGEWGLKTKQKGSGVLNDFIFDYIEIVKN